MSDLREAKENLEKILNEVREKDRQELLETEAWLEIKRKEKAEALGKEGIKNYKLALRTHDWFYDYSDDHNVWTRGFNEKTELRKLQEVLDPDYEIWDTIAPEHFKRRSK